MIDEISSFNGSVTIIDNINKESGVNNEDEGTWLYGGNKSKNDEHIDNATAPSIDEITTQEINGRDNMTITSITTASSSLINNQLDDDDSDDDDDDGIQVTIGNYEPELSTFQTNRQKNRAMLAGPVMPSKLSTTKGIDLDAQGIINGQPTYEHDLMNAYKDDEKPWKKPGADISDYFNYGFSEETWTQYCDRQRRIRTENNLARFNPTHIPPMLPGHPPMMHPINSHPIMMINKPINMPIMTRSINVKKPDGRIDVIGGNDQTSRRPIFETPNNFEHPSFINDPSFSHNQSHNGQTVGDLVSTSPANNGPSATHGTLPSGTHHMQILGPHRLPMMPLPAGMQFRPQFGHPHALGGPQFFPRGSAPGMHGDRPPQPYFVPRHPQQPWDKTGMPPVHGFPSGPFPSQVPISAATSNERIGSSRSPTPEHHSSRSSTPEENRASGNTGTMGENEKSSKDDRYKDRYRDDRDYHSSSRRRPLSRDRSSSSSYRSRHRNDEHEYERPRNDRKSSRDRDDKYERYPRKRHHRDDNNRHHYRGDEESSRSHRSSYRTPTKTMNSSISNSIESSQTINDQIEASELNQPAITSSSSPSQVNRSRHDDSERSSSRHNHHKKSSKRSRHDSDNERTSSHHHRRSKDKSLNNSKKSTNQNEPLSDSKEQTNE